MAIKTTVKHTFFDDNGDPLNGGKVYFYEAGTSTPKDTYTTSAATVANANPVILNSRGEAEIFTNGLYKVNVTTSADVQVTGYPVDNIGAGSSNNDAALRWAGTSTGSANAHVLTPTTSITAYAIGQSFVFKAGYSNSGATTVAVSGLAAIAVQNNGAALTGNEILVNRFYEIILDTLTTAQLVQTGVGGSASQAFAALAVNTAKTAVASATTPDIFAVTTGQLIDFTGSGAVTGFVAAPQAGMFRELYCAGAPTFTADANLLIEGIPSGTTITLAAGALVQIRAITTTQFKMTYSLSGTFTATGTGFTANPTTTAKYSVCNGVAYLSIPAKALTGTSNATTFTITGLPTSLVPVTKKSFGTLDAADNGGGNYAHATIAAGSNVISLWVTHETNPWTAANTKFLATSEFTYSLA